MVRLGRDGASGRKSGRYRGAKNPIHLPKDPSPELEVTLKFEI